MAAAHVWWVAAFRSRSPLSLDPRNLFAWRSFFCLAYLLLAKPNAALATDMTWSGTTSTTWATNTNWSGGAPGAGDNAVFNSTFSNQPNMTNNQSAGGI